MSDSMNDDDVGIKFGIILDKQSFNEAKKSGDNMISLISDLAIIGKVAGDSLGKMWSGVQKTVEAGIAQFDDINLGLTVGIDSEDLSKLQYAVGQIGGDKKDVSKMLKSLDAKRISFTDTATGEKELVEVIETMARYGVSDEAGQAIQEALKSGDLIETIRLFGNLRDELGENFSNIAGKLGLEGLANLEIDLQFEDWTNAWKDMSILVREANEKGLNDLSDGYAKISFAMGEASKYFGGELGTTMDALGEAISTGTSRIIEWYEGFKEKPAVKEFNEGLLKGLTDIISGDKLMLEVLAEGVMSGFGTLGKNVGSLQGIKAVDPKATDDAWGALWHDSPTNAGGVKADSGNNTQVTIESITISTEVPDDIPESVAEAIRASLGG